MRSGPGQSKTPTAIMRERKVAGVQGSAVSDLLDLLGTYSLRKESNPRRASRPSTQPHLTTILITRQHSSQRGAATRDQGVKAAALGRGLRPAQRLLHGPW